MSRSLSYFVSDVHLGLQVSDPAGREARFVAFLRGIPAARTEALYLLGDIWDFWYEYRDVVPKGYVRVFAALQALMDAGVKVYFFQGNHDIWTYRYFEELGMTRLVQPYVAEIGGKRFCLGHGDGLGPGMSGYKLMRRAFHNRFLQACFSALHPWLAFRLGNGWSRRSRLGKSIGYTFRGGSEPLYRFCASFNGRRLSDGLPPVDRFLFGHYHCAVDLPVLPAADLSDGRSDSLPSTDRSTGVPPADPSDGPVRSGNAAPEGPRLLILEDWMTASNWMVYDAEADVLERVSVSTITD